MEKKICVIVDGMSTGRYLAPSFAQYGIDCIHIFSSSKIDPHFISTFNHDDYIDNFVYDDNYHRIIEALSNYTIISVLPGTETGVLLADRIANTIGCPANPVESSQARRNKYEMSKRITDKSLVAIQQFCSNDPTELVNWVKANVDFPVVVKPVDSAGADSVRICKNFNSVKESAEKIIGMKNVLGLTNQYALVQKYIDGVEYIVNTVTVNGSHLVTDVWRCSKFKENASVVYDFEEMICPSSDEVSKEIIPYLLNVLDALELKNGPAHSELMIRDKVPYFIETGARLHGAINPEVIVQCTGKSHVTALVDSVVNPETFEKNIEKQPYVKLQKKAFCVALISHKSGILKSLTNLEKIKKLTSFYDVSVHVSIGDKIPKTKNLLTSPGEVYLIHENRDILLKDYNTIRELESEGLFDIE